MVLPQPKCGLLNSSFLAPHSQLEDFCSRTAIATFLERKSFDKEFVHRFNVRTTPLEALPSGISY